MTWNHHNTHIYTAILTSLNTGLCSRLEWWCAHTCNARHNDRSCHLQHIRTFSPTSIYVIIKRSGNQKLKHNFWSTATASSFFFYRMFLSQKNFRFRWKISNLDNIHQAIIHYRHRQQVEKLLRETFGKRKPHTHTHTRTHDKAKFSNLIICWERILFILAAGKIHFVDRFTANKLKTKNSYVKRKKIPLLTTFLCHFFVHDKKLFFTHQIHLFPFHQNQFVESVKKRRENILIM